MDDAASRLRTLLAAVLPTNPFYAEKYATAGVAADTPLAGLPFTTKAELVAGQAEYPPYGRNFTFPRTAYTRFHQTSGTTTGRPLTWLDSPADWDWVLTCWDGIYRQIGLRRTDVLFFPFSFGPFFGFWSAFDAAAKLGHLCLPGGGMSSTGRVRFLLEHSATVVFATPTYALHLAEVAAKDGVNLAASSVRMIVVAGEPGGGIPATRDRIAAAWGARVIDHYGLTEVGPVAVEPENEPGGLRVVADEYVAEVLTPAGDVVPAGEPGELVLTNLGRVGSPLVRYRTGDKVIAGRGGWLAGGILGRADDMLHVRGNNVYPAAVEAVVRRFPEAAEFRIVVANAGPMAELRIDVEAVPGADGEGLAAAVSRAVKDELLFRAVVLSVPPGTLPRFEMKARRVIQQ